MFDQPISSLDLPERKIKQLCSEGRVYCDDVDASVEGERWRLLRRAPPMKTALDLLQGESSGSNIITFCRELDDALGGGVPTKLITEFNGLPGSGKTQMCLQLCASVQLPSCFGGLDGHAVYVDTRSGFSVDRFADVASGCIGRCVLLANKYNSNEMMTSLKKLSTHSLMEGLYCLRATKFLELLSAARQLKKLLNDDSTVKLIVVDSVAKPFKRTNLDSFEKIKLVFDWMKEVQKLAQRHDCAVVFTNDLTTKFDETGLSYLSPSLGDSFAHRINNRIDLKRGTSNEEFIAHLEKSSLKPEATVEFQITERGVRGSVCFG